ncbi:LysM peptidoglycan-binding domain-containing protein [Bacillus songklensis]|uniref:LysM peptidoglycan-binding domain-containing protein n=1 Tax=Bacillus songklensis TaxID=1069116 RepID=A0ABV8B3S0_9BACI
MKKKQWVIGMTMAALLVTGANETSAHEKIYTIQSRDSLYKISRQNGVSIENLKTWNGLKNDNIYVGQTLTLLAPHSHEATYTVKSGDTLFLIAKAHNVLIADIKRKNNLAGDLIYVGQKLLIPTEKGIDSSRDSSTKVNVTDANRTLFPDKSETSASTYATIHKVQAGEYLSVIAPKYNTTVEKIKSLNGLTSNTIYVGQELKVTEGARPASATPSFLRDGIFPLAKGTYQPYGDTWGASRQYGGDRVHEGTDIFAAKGTPIYSSTDGRIVSYGWNQLGGWRITIKTNEGYSLYYAHMSKYATGLGVGVSVKKGQMIGYVGDSGYGPQGTTGKFVPHLHFGIYDPHWKAINGYDNLRYWELNNK